MEDEMWVAADHRGQELSAGEWQTLLFYRASLLSHMDGNGEGAFEVGPASPQDGEIGYCCTFSTTQQGAQHGNALCASAVAMFEQTADSKEALQMYQPPPVYLKWC